MTWEEKYKALVSIPGLTIEQKDSIREIIGVPASMNGGKKDYVMYVVTATWPDDSISKCAFPNARATRPVRLWYKSGEEVHYKDFFVDFRNFDKYFEAIRHRYANRLIKVEEAVKLSRECMGRRSGDKFQQYKEEAKKHGRGSYRKKQKGVM